MVLWQRGEHVASHNVDTLAIQIELLKREDHHEVREVAVARVDLRLLAAVYLRSPPPMSLLASNWLPTTSYRVVDPIENLRLQVTLRKRATEEGDARLERVGSRGGEAYPPSSEPLAPFLLPSLVS